MASRTMMLLALLMAIVFCIVECASLRAKRGSGYGGGYGGGYGNNLYGPYYDKYDFYYGIPGFNVYSKYGAGDNSYGKAVFASDHGYSNSYGGY